MGLSSSLFSGVSGLNAFGDAIGVIGDNLANVNTNGFKTSRFTFSDVLGNTVRRNSTIGRGAILQSVSPLYSQGSFETTSNPTDLALAGRGFFVLSDGKTPPSTFYTRAGDFRTNNQGLLVNPNGLIVQGFPYSTTTGTFSSVATNINLSTAQSSPRATTTFRLGANLGVNTASGSTFQSAFNIFNSLGETVTLTITFTKQSTSGSWTWSPSATSSSSSLTTSVTGSSSLLFNSSGSLTNGTDRVITISGFPSGASAMNVTWDLYNTSGVTNGDLTGLSAASAMSSLTQDGFSSGSLLSISVDRSGIITGLFTNGQSQNLYQLSLANFANPEGLTKLGTLVLAESASSGAPLSGVANSGGLGEVVSNALEQSNVDIAAEFIKMITTQRAYQANSRIISTVDDLLQETVNIKR